MQTPPRSIAELGLLLLGAKEDEKSCAITPTTEEVSYKCSVRTIERPKHLCFLPERWCASYVSSASGSRRAWLSGPWCLWGEGWPTPPATPVFEGWRRFDQTEATIPGPLHGRDFEREPVAFSAGLGIYIFMVDTFRGISVTFRERPWKISAATATLSGKSTASAINAVNCLTNWRGRTEFCKSACLCLCVWVCVSECVGVFSSDQIKSGPKDKVGPISPHPPPISQTGNKQKLKNMDSNDKNGKQVHTPILLPIYNRGSLLT